MLVHLIYDKEENIDIEIEKKHDLYDHIIVLGYGRLGRKICEKLELNNIKYIAIESNMHNVKEAQRSGQYVIFGNAGKRSILESVNISEASAVVIAFDNSKKLHLVCNVLSKIATKAKVVIKVNQFKEKDELLKEFPNYKIVVGTEQVANGMVDSVLACEI